jgi:hypothetical protein
METDGVITLEIRDLILEGGGYEGGAEGHGTASLTLYGAEGQVHWSVSGQVRLRSGNKFADAPTFAQFVGAVVDELTPHVQKLR